MSENTAYDPSAPEGAASPGGQYMTKKDAKWIIIVTFFLIIGMIPVYLFMREKAYKATCVKNINGVMEALTLYAAQHDDRFPPLYSENEQGEPVGQGDGAPYTWVSDVFPLMSDRVSFVCPSAGSDEYAYSMNPNGGAPIPSTYGFYAPYASYSTLLVDNPDTVIILAETSNGGANDTYDPKPFSTGKNDGFVIGWNNTNLWPDETTKAVTRLAFPGTGGGEFGKGNGRHNSDGIGMINAISASRLKVPLAPSDIATEYNASKYTLTGHWMEPIQRKK